MKRVFLLFALVTATCITHAQTSVLARPYIVNSDEGNVVYDPATSVKVKPAAKMTTAPDTVTYANNSSQISANTTYKYYVDFASTLDSGYYLGMNAYQYQGWAEAYNVTIPDDTALAVIGTISVWHGNHKLTSNKSVNIEVWDADTAHGDLLSANSFLTGFPNNVLTSQSVPIHNLKMGYNNAPDTLSVLTWFTTPASVSQDFFVGYEMAYDFRNLNGDTICIRATKQGNGTGHANFYYIDASSDTIYHVRNAVELMSGSWLDPYWQAHLNVNYSIVPIVHIRNTTGLSNIRKDGLAYYGIYPNPATNSATIKFSNVEVENISIQIMDISGRVLSTIDHGLYQAGKHEITLSTASLSSGMYLYIISDGKGASFADKIQVLK